ncbi:MAG: sigma 54-interacting transcriptional regulator, partial [Gemmatimonadales bacterium]|nr:sigma 54-interacting transcriptional regulator [Gemmatimonadales bacterium]
LDEIANFPLPLPARLLRGLESGEVERVGSSRTQRADVRLLGATIADLGREVQDGRFREDLLFRRNTVEIRLPPLRDRREDIPALAAHFREMYARRYRKAVRAFSDDALRVLLDHPWPGNVRELDHAVERAVLLAPGGGADITAGDLGLTAANGARPLDQMTLDEAERHLIAEALRRAANNVSEAARILGVSRSALYRKIRHHGL